MDILLDPTVQQRWMGEFVRIENEKGGEGKEGEQRETLPMSIVSGNVEINND